MSVRNVSQPIFGKLAVVAASSSMLLSCVAGAQTAKASKPSLVKVVGKLGSFQLMRNGVPYFIKGAGGTGDRKLLIRCGANSIRTWGADDIGAILDDAHKDGLTVTVGMWLGHLGEFDYRDATAVQKQFDMCKDVVARFKSHPAVLMWAFGNEMEGNGSDPLVWKAVNDLAKMSKSIDPNHPTMTVVAEIGGDKLKNFQLLCPDVDILGINSYGGAPTLADRYKKGGGSKPYVLTEFGPPGPWEVKKTRWSTPIEQTSTEKGDTYRKAYVAAVKSQPGLCLGAYTFLWGNKQEGTATWFGMLLPGSARLASADAMTEFWTGKAPSNLVPRIDTISVPQTDLLKPGQVLDAKLTASDPEGKPLTVKWVLTGETMQYYTAGRDEPVPEGIHDAILASSATGAKVKMPEFGGAYRLFAYVFDANGGAAVANIPIFVDGPVPKPSAVSAKLPLFVYQDGGKPTPFTPTGWMGKTAALKLDLGSTSSPHSGDSCTRIEFTSPDGWAGIAYQYPANDWGEKPESLNLAGAKRLSFWARGSSGGEKLKAEFGILGADKKFGDSSSGQVEVTLTNQWQQFSIDLKGKDMTRIKTGFVFTLVGSGSPVTLFLDDIIYE